MKHFLLFLLINLPFAAFSQFSESFSSGQLDTSWIGDRESFQIKSGMLILNSTLQSGEKTKTLTLAHPYELKTEHKEWSFYVYVNMKPSNSNYIQLYPQSSASKTFDGFYIRVGHNKQGDEAKRLSYGFDNKMINHLNTKLGDNSYNMLHIKIELFGNKEWIIWGRDAYSETTLTELARFESPVAAKDSAYFGIKWVHTSSGNKKFGVDDILIQEASQQKTETDPAPEKEDEKEEIEWSSCDFDGVEPLGTYEFKYYFTEAVDISKAAFYIEGYGYNGKAQAIRMKIVEGAPNEVVVRFPNEATLNETYTFYWENVKDQSGKPIKDGNVTGAFQESTDEDSEKTDEPQMEPTKEPTAISLTVGDIRINEIMADPNGFTPKTEYIELYSRLDSSIRLTGCKLVYGAKTFIDLSEVSILPHGYVVLYRTGNEMVSNIAAFALDKFPANLANAGKELALYDGAGNLIDQYTYSKATAGKSWEYDTAGWHLSTDSSGGTPGKVNSPIKEKEEDPQPEKEKEPEKADKGEQPAEQTKPRGESPGPKDIVINEILPEPFTGGSEYIELYNRSSKAFSLEDVAISTRKSDGTLNTVYSLGEYPREFRAEEYLLLSKSIEGVAQFYQLPYRALTHECKLPVLSNVGATIVLYRKSDLVIIDEVSYSPKWHASSIKDKKGVALERIQSDGDSQDASNWTSAASITGYGTPGKENSQHDINTSEQTETGSENISILRLQPSGNYRLEYRLPNPGFCARGWIFDIRGRRVATLIENESLGTSGTLEWNGIGNNGNRLPSGIYIQYIELWNDNGKTIRNKSAFLVH